MSEFEWLGLAQYFIKEEIMINYILGIITGIVLVFIICALIKAGGK